MAWLKQRDRARQSRQRILCSLLFYHCRGHTLSSVTEALASSSTAEPVRLSRELGSRAPDPTPTNSAGGIDTIDKKGHGALRPLGTGPGSAAVCLVGLAAAGCTLIVYTVGMTSIASAAPLTPVLKVGPPLLAASRDIDLPVREPPMTPGRTFSPCFWRQHLGGPVPERRCKAATSCCRDISRRCVSEGVSWKGRSLPVQFGRPRKTVAWACPPRSPRHP